jgi:ABC-2 type transport system permease protein
MLLNADSFLEQVLDPAGAEFASGALWPTFGGSVLLTTIGVAALFFAIRRLGPPGGALPVTDLVLGFPLAIAAFLVPGMLYVALVGPLPAQVPLAAGMIQAGFALGCILLVARNPWRLPEDGKAEWFRTRPLHLALTPLVWLLAAPALVCAMLAAVALAHLAGIPVTEQAPISHLRSDDSALWIAGWYVTAGVAAPLMEEFVFRLVLFGGILRVMAPLSDAQGWEHPGPWTALLVSGGLFVLVHGVADWSVGILPLSVLTFVLSAVYLHTRSIWPPVLLHAIHNIAVVTLQFFVVM